MFGTLGGPEVILILVVALIVFGPRRLPEIGKSMGKMLAEFRKASNDFKRTIDEELEAEKTRESQAAAAPPETPAAATEVTPTEVAPAAADASGASAPASAMEAAPVVTPPETAEPGGSAAPPGPHVEAPAEPVVSRGGSAEKS
jgi:Tat protein translocase TatB subunit